MRLCTICREANFGGCEAILPKHCHGHGNSRCSTLSKRGKFVANNCICLWFKIYQRYWLSLVYQRIKSEWWSVLIVQTKGRVCFVRCPNFHERWIPATLFAPFFFWWRYRKDIFSSLSDSASPFLTFRFCSYRKVELYFPIVKKSAFTVIA